MLYSVHLMCREDVSQVNEIDGEVFSSQWPPPNYQHELENKLAHYLVACDETRLAENLGVKIRQEKITSELLSWLGKWFRHGSSLNDDLSLSSRPYIIGFAGIWILAGEAHITNIAVRPCYQRRGIGELLLMHLIDLAKEVQATMMTLEVRVSNTTAQKLYSKYGFTQVGLRRAYYTDNREDALLMSTESLTANSFQEHIEDLRRAFMKKWGTKDYQLTINYQDQRDN